MEVIIIKYLINKSKEIIFIFISISIVTTLCLSSFIEAFRMVSIPPDLLSKNYVNFSIKPYNKDNLNISDIINYMSSYNNILFYKVEKLSNSKGVYFNEESLFKLNIIDGRNFNENDFLNNTNTVLISDEIINKCIIENGNKYILHNNNYYEVIGVYEKSNNKINLDSDYYFNLLAENNINNLNMLNGTFILDTNKENSEAIINSLKTLGNIEINESEISNTFIERIEKTLSVQAINLTPIVLIVILIFLNTIGITTKWIEDRKNELRIKALLGANYNRLKAMLFKEYLCITIISFLIGYFIAYIISYFDFKIFVGFRFSIITCIGTFIIIFILGLISGSIMTISYKKLIVLN